MSYSSSPPPEALEFRGKTLTPVSPKPVHFPSPSNIPILEKQMDPVFHESAFQVADNHHTTDLQTTDLYDQASADPHQSSSAILDDGANHTQNESVIAQSIAEKGNFGLASSVAAQNAAATNDQDHAAIQSLFKPNPQTAAAHSDAPPALSQADQNSAQNSHNPAMDLDQNAVVQDRNEPSMQDQAVQRLDGNMESNGGVNLQALLDNLSSTSANAGLPELGFANSTAAPSNSLAPLIGDTSSPPSALAGNANLPPRPPPQEKPVTHPNYTPGDDIRSYHPHSQQAVGSSFRAQSGGPPVLTVGSSGLPPPPAASFQSQPPSASTQPQSPVTPGHRQNDSISGRVDKDAGSDDDINWSPEVEKLYDDFLHDERVYVTEGQWDKFPPSSRMFIGNLPTEKVTKRDIFHVFYKHGKLAQISIKQAYGFVQFLDAASCYRALQAEQGVLIRGRKMHLEISKPQRNSRNSEGSGNARGARRRSRSPDYSRGSGGSGPRGVDRYTGGQNGSSPRDREFRRVRDDYRPGRSPSPRGFRGGRGRDRSRDRYDDRRRSRSRSPYGRGRYRSPTPQRDLDDDLPLPRRAPRDVPDVQMLVLEDLDRNFIAFVEKAFKDRGVRCDVLLLSPRLSEAAVVRRQILEGVQAVSRLTRISQQTGKIPLQVFDRRGGADNVRFEEYDNLDPAVCAELVLRAKQTHTPSFASYGVPPASYGVPAQYGLPPAQPQPAPQVAAAVHPGLSSLITSLDGAGLQKLLGAMQQQQSPQAAPHQGPQVPGLTPDLARLLGGGAAQAQQPLYTQQAAQAPPQSNPYGAFGVNPSLASLLATPGAAQAAQVPTNPQSQQQRQTPMQGQQPSQANMQEIMAQLAKYRR